MEEILLMEKLQDKEVSLVCRAAMNAADKFILNYCSRNDCQHASSNICFAIDLLEHSKGLKIKDLPAHPYEFGDMRVLLSEILKPRGLKPKRMYIYNKEIQPVELKSYATADEFVNMLA